MLIREAKCEDAEAICELLISSITTLCVADHKNDPAILQKWLGNKTPERMATWMKEVDHSMFVAEEEGVLVAVGGLKNAGEITLNYVSPEARLRGLSRKMIAWIEAVARERGIHVLRFSSTGTARRFYLSCGYAEKETKIGYFGAQVFVMEKAL